MNISESSTNQATRIYKNSTKHLFEKPNDKQCTYMHIKPAPHISAQDKHLSRIKWKREIDVVVIITIMWLLTISHMTVMESHTIKAVIFV